MMFATPSFPGRGLIIALHLTAAGHPLFAHSLAFFRRGILERLTHFLAFFRRGVSPASAAAAAALRTRVGLLRDSALPFRMSSRALWTGDLTRLPALR